MEIKTDRNIREKRKKNIVGPTKWATEKSYDYNFKGIKINRKIKNMSHFFVKNF